MKFLFLIKIDICQDKIIKLKLKTAVRYNRNTF